MSNQRDIIETALAFGLAVGFYFTLTIVLNTSMPLVSVVSESMEPVMHRGDLLLIVGTEDYNVGDVAIYQKPNMKITIIHRIIQKRDDGFVFKGDNNNAPDPYLVKKSEIKGEAIFVAPLVGYPRLALQLVGI